MLAPTGSIATSSLRRCPWNRLVISSPGDLVGSVSEAAIVAAAQNRARISATGRRMTSPPPRSATNAAALAGAPARAHRHPARRNVRSGSSGWARLPPSPQGSDQDARLIGCATTGVRRCAAAGFVGKGGDLRHGRSVAESSTGLLDMKFDMAGGRR